MAGTNALGQSRRNKKRMPVTSSMPIVKGLLGNQRADSKAAGSRERPLPLGRPCPLLCVCRRLHAHCRPWGGGGCLGWETRTQGTEAAQTESSWAELVSLAAWVFPLCSADLETPQVAVM